MTSATSMIATITDAPEFEYLQKLVLERSGIVLSDDKKYLVESRLMPMVRSMGLTNTREVIGRARDTRDGGLEEAIVEAMTTNETLWFRDVHPFNALRRTILPTTIRRKSATRRLSLWSAASSSGQEIYSLAMLIEDDFPEVRDWHVDLVATDLSSRVLEKARQGVYSTLEVNRGLPASLMIRHFDKEGNAYRIKESLRNRVRFERLNLASPWPSLPTFDIIMLRNVLIYFNLVTKQRILAHVADRLAPDGCLFLGAAETTIGISDLFEAEKTEGATFYRLKGRR